MSNLFKIVARSCLYPYLRSVSVWWRVRIPAIQTVPLCPSSVLSCLRGNGDKCALHRLCTTKERVGSTELRNLLHRKPPTAFRRAAVACSSTADTHDCKTIGVVERTTFASSLVLSFHRYIMPHYRFICFLPLSMGAEKHFHTYVLPTIRNPSGWQF